MILETILILVFLYWTYSDDTLLTPINCNWPCMWYVWQLLFFIFYFTILFKKKKKGWGGRDLLHEDLLHTDLLNKVYFLYSPSAMRFHLIAGIKVFCFSKVLERMLLFSGQWLIHLIPRKSICVQEKEGRTGQERKWRMEFHKGSQSYTYICVTY